IFADLWSQRIPLLPPPPSNQQQIPKAGCSGTRNGLVRMHHTSLLRFAVKTIVYTKRDKSLRAMSTRSLFYSGKPWATWAHCRFFLLRLIYNPLREVNMMTLWRQSRTGGIAITIGLVPLRLAFI